MLNAAALIWSLRFERYGQRKQRCEQERVGAREGGESEGNSGCQGQQERGQG